MGGLRIVLGNKWGERRRMRRPTVVAVVLAVAAVVAMPTGSLVAATGSTAAGTTATAALNAPGTLHTTRAEGKGAALLTWKAPARRRSTADHQRGGARCGRQGRPSGRGDRRDRSVASGRSGPPTPSPVSPTASAYRFASARRTRQGLGPGSLSPAVTPTANARPTSCSSSPTTSATTPSRSSRTRRTNGWLQFTNSYVDEPMCCPSRSTFFTGRYSHHTNVQTLLQGKNLDDRRPSRDHAALRRLPHGLPRQVSQRLSLRVRQSRATGVGRLRGLRGARPSTTTTRST